jgi:MFS family permease
MDHDTLDDPPRGGPGPGGKRLEDAVHGAAPRRVVLASMIGTTLEFYDFIVYGTVAALVFNTLFFPSAAPGVGTLLALSTFAVGFLARPIGAALFGHLGDRIGRRRTLMLTLLIMGGATVLIGLLPSYASIGFWAPVLLVVLRVLQGAAVGGEWGGAVLLISEHAGEGRRGQATSFAQLGSPVGLLLANGVVLGAVAVAGTAGFQNWGWRVPFLLSVVLIVVGVILRRTVEESPVFRRMQQEQVTAKSPVTEVLRQHWGRLLVAIGVTVVSFGGYYVFTTVGLAYLALHKVPSAYGLYGTVIGAGLCVPVILACGALSDRVGRRPVYAASAVVMGVWAFVFFPLLDTGDGALVALAFAGGLVGWGVLYGAQGAFLSELFPSRVRYTGASLAYQVTGALGGLVPLVSLSLLETTGTSAAIAVFVALTAVVSLVAVRIAPETSRMRLAELDARSGRATPTRGAS